jgi:hypothetical protein
MEFVSFCRCRSRLSQLLDSIGLSSEPESVSRSVMETLFQGGESQRREIYLGNCMS